MSEPGTCSVGLLLLVRVFPKENKIFWREGTTAPHDSMEENDEGGEETRGALPVPSCHQQLRSSSTLACPLPTRPRQRGIPREVRISIEF